MAASTVERWQDGDSGAVAVEFVLVLPILLYLVFGIINWGLIFTAQISLNSAARDSARAGVVQPLGGSGLTCGQIASMAQRLGSTLDVATTSVAVTVTGPDGTTSCSLPAGTGKSVTGSGDSTLCTGSSSLSGPQLTVNLSYDYTAPLPLVPPSSWTLKSTGQFQCEYS